MNQKGSTTIILIIGLVVAVFLGAWLLIGVTGINPKKITQNPEPTNYPAYTPTPRINPVKDIPDKTPQELGIDLTQKRLRFDNTNSLYLSSLDGKYDQLIYKNSEKDHVSLAGNFLDQGKVYYQVIPKIGDLGQIFLYDLATNQATKIFEFPINEYSRDSYGVNAAINNNGDEIAYTGIDGVRVYSIKSKKNRLIAKNKTECDTNGFTCFGFGYPQFSADGKFMLLQEYGYEGGAKVLVNLETGQLQDLNIQVLDGSWAKSGDRLALFGPYYSEAPLIFINDPLTPKKMFAIGDLVPQFKGTGQSFWVGDWAKNGSFAFIFEVSPNTQEGRKGIGVIDPENNFQEVTSLASSEAKSIEWLDQDQGILLNTNNNGSFVIGTKTVGKYKLPVNFD